MGMNTTALVQAARGALVAGYVFQRAEYVVFFSADTRRHDFSPCGVDVPVLAYLQKVGATHVHHFAYGDSFIHVGLLDDVIAHGVERVGDDGRVMLFMQESLWKKARTYRVPPCPVEVQVDMSQRPRKETAAMPSFAAGADQGSLFGAPRPVSWNTTLGSAFTNDANHTLRGRHD